MKKIILISAFLLFFMLSAGVLFAETVNISLEKHGHHGGTEKASSNLLLPPSYNSMQSSATLLTLNPEFKLEGTSVFHFYKMDNRLQVNTVLTYSKGNTTYIVPHSFILKTPGDFSLHFSLTNSSKN